MAGRRGGGPAPPGTQPKRRHRGCRRHRGRHRAVQGAGPAGDLHADDRTPARPPSRLVRSGADIKLAISLLGSAGEGAYRILRQEGNNCGRLGRLFRGTVERQLPAKTIGILEIDYGIAGGVQGDNDSVTRSDGPELEEWFMSGRLHQDKMDLRLRVVVYFKLRGCLEEGHLGRERPRGRGFGGQVGSALLADREIATTSASAAMRTGPSVVIHHPASRAPTISTLTGGGAGGGCAWGGTHKVYDGRMPQKQRRFYLAPGLHGSPAPYWMPTSSMRIKLSYQDLAAVGDHRTRRRPGSPAVLVGCLSVGLAHGSARPPIMGW